MRVQLSTSNHSTRTLGGGTRLAAVTRGNQKRLARCFRALEFVGQPHKNIEKVESVYFFAAGPSTMAYLTPMGKRLSPLLRWVPGGYFEVDISDFSNKLTYPKKRRTLKFRSSKR